jgi:hypothetical protein
MTTDTSSGIKELLELPFHIVKGQFDELKRRREEKEQ